MGQLYTFLGLTVGLNLERLLQKKKSKQPMLVILLMVRIMNLALTICAIIWCFIKNKWYSVRLHYAVIDEVDSILIDEARTPLIISGSGAKSTQLYIQANALYVR